jgi:hypothetical protein
MNLPCAIHGDRVDISSFQKENTTWVAGLVSECLSVAHGVEHNVLNIDTI